MWLLIYGLRDRAQALIPKGIPHHLAVDLLDVLASVVWLIVGPEEEVLAGTLPIPVRKLRHQIIFIGGTL